MPDISDFSKLGSAQCRLMVDKGHLERSIVVLATAVPGSIRGIQTCLEEVLDTRRSTGFISQTLQKAGEAAVEQKQLDSGSSDLRTQFARLAAAL